MVEDELRSGVSSYSELVPRLIEIVSDLTEADETVSDTSMSRHLRRAAWFAIPVGN